MSLELHAGENTARNRIPHPEPPEFEAAIVEQPTVNQRIGTDGTLHLFTAASVKHVVSALCVLSVNYFR